MGRGDSERVRSHCKRKKGVLAGSGIKEAVARTLTHGSCLCRDGRGELVWQLVESRRGGGEGTGHMRTGCLGKPSQSRRDPAFLCSPERERGRSKQTQLQGGKEKPESLGLAAAPPGAGGQEPRAFVGREEEELGGVALSLKKERAGKALSLGERCLCVACRAGRAPQDSGGGGFSCRAQRGRS